MKSDNLSIKESISKIFEVLKFINISKGNTIFESDEINEQTDNINDLQETINKLKNILENIKNCAVTDNEKLRKDILELHFIIGDIEWQYDQIHDMIRKVGSLIQEEN